MDTRKIYFEQAITRVHDRIIEPSGNVYTPCSKKEKPQTLAVTLSNLNRF